MDLNFNTNHINNLLDKESKEQKAVFYWMTLMPIF